MSLKNWVRQKVSTVGTGSIVLTDSASSFIRVSAAYADGQGVFYSLIDGNNRENGYGIYTAAGNTITRSVIFESLVSGAYTNSAVAPITLTGNAYMSVMATTKSILTHDPIWKTLESTPMVESSLGYASPGVIALIGGVMVPAFDASVEETLGIKFRLNNDVAVGSFMYPTVQWSPSTTNIGTVRWGIEYSQADALTGVFSATSTMFIEQASTGVTGSHLSAEVLDANKLTATNPDTIIIGRIYRDATHVNDTYTGDAALHSVSLKYLAKQVGTPKRVADYFNWG